MTYKLINPPTWLSIDSQSGVITAQPNISVSGDFIVSLIAFDGKLSSKAMLTIHVEKIQFEVTTSRSGIRKISPEKCF
ncbi:TPA: cadherin repeat domain-containing protein [Photobacterium damselae]